MSHAKPWHLALLGLLLIIASWVPGWIVPVLPQESQRPALENDLAHALFAADQLCQGKIPHEDFFWHYGLLPLYGFAAWCELFGDASVDAYVWHQKVLGTAASVLCLLLLIRTAGRKWGFLIWILTGFAWAFNGQQLYGPYQHFLVILVAFLWARPCQRSGRSLWIVGVLLGLLQSVKFGLAFVLGLAWLLTDIAWILHLHRPQSYRKAWLREMLRILAGFAVVEGILIAQAFLSLPLGLAKEALLPLFQMEWYASYVRELIPLPRFANWGYFFGYQLPLLIGVIGGPVAVHSLYRSRKPGSTRGAAAVASEMDRAMPGVMLAFVYVLGWSAYFKHTMNLMGYGWLLAPAIGAFWFAVPNQWVRIALVTLLLPSGCLIPLGAWRALRGDYAQAAPGLERFEMANGQSLWLEEDYGSAIEAVVQHLSPIQNGPDGAPRTGFHGGFVILPMGSGLHHFGKIPAACRHSWFFPGTIRPFERGAILDRMLQARAIVVHLDSGLSATAGEGKESWRFDCWRPFGHASEDQQLLSALSAPEHLPDGWLIFPLCRQSQ